MILEEELQQNEFASAQQKALINVIFTANQINLFSQRYLRTWGISPQMFNILRILRNHKPDVATIMSIQDKMLDRMSNASRLVDKLVEKKLCNRILNKGDRRKVDVKITAKGESLLKTIEESELESKFLNISKADAEAMNKILDKMRG